MVTSPYILKPHSGHLIEKLAVPLVVQRVESFEQAFNWCVKLVSDLALISAVCVY